jgi:glycosyltransferase involved in cell wall biosynthesis
MLRKMKSSKVAIVIAAYNEEKVIKNVLEKLRGKRPEDIIIVVDDGSIDKTYEEACEVKGLYVLKHVINLGQGAALQTGIEMAKKLNVTYVVTFDADGQHDADDIDSFINVMEEEDLDIAMGSRFLSYKSNVPAFKKFVLKLSTLFTWIVSGIKLTDSHNGFRVINIAKNPNFKITQNRMEHASEIIDIIKSLDMKYKELPCHIYYTDYSKAKGQSVVNSINILIEYFTQRIIK